MTVFAKCCNGCRSSTRNSVCRHFVFVTTFIVYMFYHMSRRPPSIVKNVLNRNCSDVEPPSHMTIPDDKKNSWCNWIPFDGENANQLLGYLDSAYLFAYAFAMFLSGYIAERVDLCYFLTLGMLFSGIFTYLYGLAYYYQIHSYGFFIVVMVFGGMFQSTGWPGVVACMGNWFGKTRRGLIFGIWNAHLYIGNILGAYIAGLFVETNWGLSFVVPGAILGIFGFFVFLFLPPSPEDAGCASPDSPRSDEDTEVRPLMTAVRIPVLSNSSSESKTAISFWGALRIPGVVEFSLCLFFAKLVSYTFLFWLPRYFGEKGDINAEDSANLSIPFDMGGMVGGIIAGFISDVTGASAITCLVFLAVAVPMMFIFSTFGTVSSSVNILLQVICGAFVNGPYALITTAVSAELGTHYSLRGNSKALATVTAIIDGTGSFGAAVGPLLAGIVSETNWNNVFYMVMISDFLALLALLRVAWYELKRLKTSRC